MWRSLRTSDVATRYSFEQLTITFRRHFPAWPFRNRRNFLKRRCLLVASVWHFSLT